MAFIEFRDYSVWYKIKRDDYYEALSGLTFAIEEGEFVVIVGPSGCGKTTLLRSILGESKYTQGKLLFNGKDIREVNLRRENVSFVTQEYSLYPQMTVYENISYSLRIMRTDPKELDKRTRDMAEKLGITHCLTRKPRQLSGGQHQRVAIARALIKNPRLVLFDEPFSALEQNLRIEMRELVKKLHKEFRPTFLFVTHDMTEAFELAERIIVMNDGEIEQIATPKELEENPTSDIARRFFNK